MLDDEKQAELDQLHKVMLAMLHDFVEICEENDILYFANFGTAIGAFRHGGFIPWDDDIDICMLRPDFERFIETVRAAPDSRYEMMSAEIDGNYPLTTARFMLKGTEFRDEALRSMKCNSGIFIDLFPLDNVADDPRGFERQSRMAWLMSKLMIAAAIDEPFIAGSGLRRIAKRAAVKVLRVWFRLTGATVRTYYGKCREAMLRYRDIDTERVAYLCDSDRHWNIVRRDELMPRKILAFEDLELAFPGNVDEWLRGIYGDYMVPPPEDQREAHFPVVLDFGPYGEEVWRRVCLRGHSSSTDGNRASSSSGSPTCGVTTSR